LFIPGSYRISIFFGRQIDKGQDMQKIVLAAVSGIAMAMASGCVIVDADVRESDWGARGDFGYLYGAEISIRDPEITITAHSNGCTQKEDFDFVVRDRDDDEFEVGFRRERADNCKALMPEGRRMTWSFAELGLPRNARVMIINRVGR
jgi:hypothetical protein